MYFIISAMIIVIDQLTKHYMIQFLGKYGVHMLIENVLELTLVKNKGAAFGILQNQTLFFTIITMAVAIALVYLLTTLPGQFLIKISLSLILGGAIGNLIDRIRLGYVVDFIHINHWPVFNVADMCIVVGSVLLAAYALFSEKSRG